MDLDSTLLPPSLEQEEETFVGQVHTISHVMTVKNLSTSHLCAILMKSQMRSLQVEHLKWDLEWDLKLILLTPQLRFLNEILIM